jgi:hypothetical protein
MHFYTKQLIVNYTIFGVIIQNLRGFKAIIYIFISIQMMNNAKLGKIMQNYTQFLGNLFKIMQF